MSDAHKTTVVIPKPYFIRPSEASAVFMRLFHQIDDDVRGGMTLPSDPHDRQIAINTVNNVMDRLQEAIERAIKKAEK